MMNPVMNQAMMPNMMAQQNNMIRPNLLQGAAGQDPL
jgi:hypothetical protein